MKSAIIPVSLLILTLSIVLSGCNSSSGGSGGSEKPNPGGNPVSASDLECSTNDSAGAVNRCLGVRDRALQLSVKTRIELWGEGLQGFLGRSDFFPKELLTTQYFVTQFGLQPEETNCLTESLCRK